MKNKFISAFCTLIVICCFSMLSINITYAQEYGIYELTSNSELSKQNSKKNGKIQDRKEFYNLTKNLHTTLYYGDNKLKNKYGEGAPFKLTFDDINTFNSLNKKDDKFNEVVLITITIKNENDLNKTIELSNIHGISKLKYIYIKCLFDCDSDKIKKNISKSNHKVRIFYTSERPS